MATRPTVRAANAVAATGHHLATAAALDAFRDGGSAVDGAIAAAAVCAVVMPQATSIGGDCFALIYDARTREVSAFNGSGVAPRALDLADFAGGFPARGATNATVPGSVAAWEDMLAAGGRLGLDRALRAAISYAEDGFPVSDRLSAAMAENAEQLMADPECARTYLPRGHAPHPGEILQQPDLAASLREIARGGADALYRGDLAERVALGMRAVGGALSAEDLDAHRTDRPEALSVGYRGLRVFGQPPVSQGHVLLEELAIAGGLDLRRHAYGGAELVHLMVEIKKLAFADRDARAGDPRVVDFDPLPLLEPELAAARRRLIGPRAADHAEPADLAIPTTTTYLAVVDRDGNAVSLIESVFSNFGAAAMVPGTGILLNDRLTGFSLDGASPNALAPGKRPVHTLNTVIALDGSSPRLVFGSPGRHAQVQTNFQLAVALIDFEMDVQEAIEQPRWFHQSGRTLRLESRYPEEVVRALTGKGHEVALLSAWDSLTGGAQVVAIDRNGVFAAGADPRREGVAGGF